MRAPPTRTPRTPRRRRRRRRRAPPPAPAAQLVERPTRSAGSRPAASPRAGGRPAGERRAERRARGGAAASTPSRRQRPAGSSTQPSSSSAATRSASSRPVAARRAPAARPRGERARPRRRAPRRHPPVLVEEALELAERLHPRARVLEAQLVELLHPRVGQRALPPQPPRTSHQPRARLTSARRLALARTSAASSSHRVAKAVSEAGAAGSSGRRADAQLAVVASSWSCASAETMRGRGRPTHWCRRWVVRQPCWGCSRGGGARGGWSAATKAMLSIVGAPR